MSSRERFLLTTLAGIFAVQSIIFIQGFYYCSKLPEACPELGDRYDNTFAAMTAGVMGLLAGSSIRKE